MADLISRKALIEWYKPYLYNDQAVKPDDLLFDLKAFPTVDAVEVEAIRAWLYEIAMNNTDNYLCDACEEIISRLDGLRVFARERKENEQID